MGFRKSFPFGTHNDVIDGYHTMGGMFHLLVVFMAQKFISVSSLTISSANPLFPFPDRLPSVFSALGEKAIS